MNKRVILPIIIVAIIGVLGYGGMRVYDFVRTDNVQETPKVVETPKPVEQEHPPTVDELLQLVNEERAKVGVAALVLDERLNQSAQWKADDMAKYDYFAHESDKSPNNRGFSRQWLIASGVQCGGTSENIVYATNTTLAMQWWINSRPHYEAMISPSYTTTGFGIVYQEHMSKDSITSSTPVTSDMTSSYMIVQHFCQP